ncbi:MAG: hypothetical protein GY745_22065 [Actinomycetia bacterium]|nr:hypothetical protein [Actinomycetes bacterium]
MSVNLPQNIAVHTSRLSLTTEQPANNTVRGAVQTVALGLAGVSALEISTFDEGYRTPSKEAHLVGLRTQQVVDLETNTNSVQDPFGGSWFMESLTDDVEVRILAMVEDIESRGDPAELVSSGYFKQFFHGTMGRYHQQVHEGDVVKVGMNVHQMPTEDDTLLRDISEEKIEPLFGRIEKLGAYREGRDQQRLLESFQRLCDVVQSDENMLPAVLECTEAGATMGEIAGIMREAWGTPYDPYGYLDSPLGGSR